MRAWFCLLLVVASSPTKADERITWLDNYAEVLRVARLTRKPIFLEFRCAP